MTARIPRPRVISLIGQMGSGKSTVARALEAELARAVPEARLRRVDLDEAITDHLGMTIAACFQTHGEAYFRDAERAVMEALVAGVDRDETLILATGGGAPCSASAIATLLRSGDVFWLDVPPEQLVARALTSDRPLLAGRDPADAAAFLTAQRAARMPFYARAQVHLDGTLPPAALATTIAQRYQETTMPSTAPIMPAPLDVILPAEADAPAYPIVFVAGLPGEAAADLADRLLPSTRRLLVVTDSNVGPLYADDLVQALSSIPRFDIVRVHTVEAGEASKRLDVLAGICDAALEAGLSRYDALVALGGGVVGDLTGFAASILHRGVPVIQIPTSLLAQVDSSVGGKTGINHARGKNLLGSFWQPIAVVSSQHVLRTLAPREFRCGLAEAIKHAVIADAPFMRWIEENADAIDARDATALATLVYRCCTIKRDVVVRDPRDKGERALLNFGHTLGHAYERLVGYGTLTHGEAVALGMLWAARLSESLASESGVAPSLVAPIEALLRRFGFTTNLDAPELPGLPALLAAARTDKKADASGVVRFVTLIAIGAAAVTPISWEVVTTHLNAPPPAEVP